MAEFAIGEHTFLRSAVEYDIYRRRRDYEIIRSPLLTLLLSTLLAAIAVLIRPHMFPSVGNSGFFLLWILFASASILLLIVSLRKTSWSPRFYYNETVNPEQIAIHRCYARDRSIDPRKASISSRTMGSPRLSKWCSKNLYEAVIWNESDALCIESLTKSEIDLLEQLVSIKDNEWPFRAR